jgi:hypothetical protein
LKQLTSFKTFALVITLCMLSVGMTPAKSSCSANCCAQFKYHGSHSMAESTPVGLHLDCCSGSETAPCPHMLESANEIDPYAISAASAEVNPVTVKLGAVSADTLIRPPSHHVAASVGPPIRGPSVPLFLRNLSLLI